MWINSMIISKQKSRKPYNLYPMYFQLKARLIILLREWVEKHDYNIIYLDKEYNFHHSHKSKEETVEVLITNYSDSHNIEISYIIYSL